MADTDQDAEIELTFDAGEGFTLPDLRDLDGVAEVTAPAVRELEAVYYDTDDYRLAAHGHTLRRRTGGHDAGWHLKRPRADGFRDEIQEPLGEAGAVPPALRRFVEVHARGADLVPAVVLRTRRTVTELRDAAGAVLVEIAQDEVTAELPASGGRAAEVVRWSEVEAELVRGGMPLLQAVRDRLVRAGARLSDSPSKLARALGDRVPAEDSMTRDAGSTTKGGAVGKGRTGTTAGSALTAYLAEQVAHLLAQDPLVRADAHDAVHQMRVASRRLRAVLAAFRPVVDADAVAPVRDELTWLGEVLGAARDSEVVRDRLLAAVASQPAELVVGPVEQFVTETFAARYRAAHDGVLEALDSPRYFALLGTLEALVAAPPAGPAAGDPAGKVFRKQVARTYRRVQRQVDDARAAAGEEREELFHQVRKSAKRARYAGEAAGEVLGGVARRYAQAMKAVQEVLGEHQDGAVARAELRTLAEAADAAGHSTFTYGRLHGLEQAAAERALEGFDEAWREAKRVRLR
ncbi:MAG TPA: CYTH and CHAD domain-containing protein [Kineosporiaceae bacterium]|nr:CYTH and CHAD domain-containing protein [Kineosporiaceae bacterium]